MADNQDKPMNQFTVANNGSYLYAEAADGSQVKIAKADLLNALGLSGCIYKHLSAYISAGATKEIDNVGGFVLVKNGYSFGGFLLYHATFSTITLVCNPVNYNIGVELSVSNGKLTIVNKAEEQRLIEVYYQSLDI